MGESLQWTGKINLKDLKWESGFYVQVCRKF
jgi:hypothetical protein